MNNVITVRNLSFGYDKNKTVLKEINVDVAASRITVLLGKNGCGKSTLIDCIMGFHPYKNGEIVINGADLKAMSEKQIAKNAAYIPQVTVGAVDFTVLEFIAFGRNCHLGVMQRLGKDDLKIAAENAKKCGLTNLIGQSVNRLSGGERQLAYFARALTQDTPIIIMDEPLASLDVSNQRVVLNMIKTVAKEGKTVVFSTHNPNHALYLDADVVIIDGGEIVAKGKAKETVTAKTLKTVYGEHICNSADLPYTEISFT